MAPTNPLDDEITCPDWSEVYIDPQVTSPPYTFCLQCIQLLNQGTTDHCPQCQDTTQQQIKHSITDLLQKHDDLIQVSTELCGLCKTTGRPIKYRCEVCDDFMCEQCEKTHSGMKLCRSHTVKSISHLTQTFQQSLQSTLSQLQSDFTLTDQQSQTVTHNIKLVTSSRRTQIEHVQAHCKDIINSVKEYEQHLIGQIQKENTKILESLWDERNTFNDSKQKIQHNIDCVNEMINSEDFITLKQNTINNTMRENMVEIKSMLPEVSQMTLSPVTVQTNSQWDVNDSIHIHVHHKVNDRKLRLQREQVTLETSEEEIQEAQKPTDSASFKNEVDKSESSQPTASEIIDEQQTLLIAEESNTNKLTLLPRILFPNLCKTEYKLQIRKNTRHAFYKLCDVKGNIWYAGREMITVFNKQCEEVQNIHHDLMLHITGLTFSESNNQVIVSCYDTGLHQLGTDGQYQRHIHRGQCADVCLHSEYLYTLDYNNKVIVFAYGDQWQRLTEVQVKYNNISMTDRLRINDIGIYIGSWKNKRIYRYTMEGEFLEEIRYRHTLLEKFTFQDKGYLALCDVDDEGNLLVANTDNRKLYVAGKKTWQVVTLTGSEPIVPFHCLVDRDENLWVGTWSSDIMKYQLLQK